LARFLVMTEKLPGMVNFFLDRPDMLSNWQKNKEFSELAEGTGVTLFQDIGNLLKDPKIDFLVTGQNDPFKPDEFINLCNWYGFRYYK